MYMATPNFSLDMLPLISPVVSKGTRSCRDENCSFRHDAPLIIDHIIDVRAKREPHHQKNLMSRAVKVKTVARKEMKAVERAAASLCRSNFWYLIPDL